MLKIRDDIYLGNNNVSLCNVGVILNDIAKQNNTHVIWWIKGNHKCICEQDEYENNLIWHQDNNIPKPKWSEIYRIYTEICNSRGLQP